MGDDGTDGVREKVLKSFRGLRSLGPDYPPEVLGRGSESKTNKTNLGTS